MSLKQNRVKNNCCSLLYFARLVWFFAATLFSLEMENDVLREFSLWFHNKSCFMNYDCKRLPKMFQAGNCIINCVLNNNL